MTKREDEEVNRREHAQQMYDQGRWHEPDQVAEDLYREADAIVRRLNARLTRIGSVTRYSLASGTSGKALDRRAAKRAAAAG